jgi:hypothetical protein
MALNFGVLMGGWWNSRAQVLTVPIGLYYRSVYVGLHRNLSRRWQTIAQRENAAQPVTCHLSLYHDGASDIRSYHLGAGD